MVADVFTGVIFALLPGNTLLLAMTMFNTEHVNILFVKHSIFPITFIFIFITSNSDYIRCSHVYMAHNQHCVCLNMASTFLLLCI